MQIKRATLALSLIAAFGGNAMAQSCPGGASAFAYPVTQKVDQQDNYHGTVIADPYRWLEDANSAETKTWVDAENKVTQDYLAQIPARAAIKERLTRLWNFERFSVPYKEGGRYFYSRNDGLQNQSVLYTVKSLGDTPRVLLDPNTLAADGTVALAGLAVSPDGKHLAYSIAASGSDWNEVKVRDIETGQDRSDHIKWVKFSNTAWAHDGSGFYYSRYDEPTEAARLSGINYFQKVYFHKLGTEQSADVLVYDRPDQKEWGFSTNVTDDGHYLVISSSQGTERKRRIFYKDLKARDGKVTGLLEAFDADYDFIDNDGPVFYFRTDKNAQKSRIVAIDIRKPAIGDWKEIVPEQAATLAGASIVNKQLVLNYLTDAHSAVKIADLKGKAVREVSLPGIGSAGGFGGKRGDTETFYSYTSFTTPATIYRYDMKSGKSTVFRQPKVDFDPAAYETRQEFFTSKDGTRVPMFIVSKKGLKMDGSNPTYLYGYGGFNISMTPGFSPANLAWMEMGGVYVVANLRGGGEYGESWHEAGTKLKKQNVFDDFIGAAEWLVNNKLTSPSKLAIGGGSNGGLLVGATFTQRPELFNAVVCQVPLLDMRRFHTLLAGASWMAEYGNPDDPAEWAFISKYSPYQNVRKGGKYPKVLFTTSTRDDRVHPAHARKMAALMLSQGHELLYYENIEGGHGGAADNEQRAHLQALEYSYLWQQLGR